MSDVAFWWLVRTAGGGGLILLIGWLLQRRLADPTRRQRLGEWSVIAALLVPLLALAPAPVQVPVPLLAGLGASASTAPTDAPTPEPLAGSESAVEPDDLAAWPPAAADDGATADLAAAPPAWWQTLGPIDWLMLAYGGIVTTLLLRWLAANAAVWWLMGRRRPVAPALAELFAEMSAGRRYRLVVSGRARVPFSVGLISGTVVLPARLAEQATPQELRWVLAHELTHLDRQDTRTCWLFAAGAVVYFFLPWFWWLRRQVRLCQEYLADAAAVRWADEPADYAQFLIAWAGRPLAAATGVSGSGSDLYRRVMTMLQANRISASPRCPHRWLTGVACGMLSLAILAGGVGLRAWAAEDDKTDKKKDDAPPVEKKAAPKKDKPERQLPKAFRDFPGFDLDDQAIPFAPGMNEEAFKAMRQQMEAARRQMEQMLQGIERGQPGFAMPFGGLDRAPRAAGRRPEPRLGVQVQKPSAALADQLDLPKDRGLVLEEVGPNSPAARAGLKQHDILLELNGQPVPSQVNAFVKQLDALKANQPIDAVVLRKGQKETIKGLTLPERKVSPEPDEPAAPAPLPGVRGGLFGGGGPLGRGGMTSISRSNDEFTARHRAGEVSYTVKGTIAQGKAKVSEVVIDTNGQKATYDSLDKVPAEHRAKVQKLAEMSARGTVRFPQD